MLAIPSYDGKVDVHFADSLLRTYILAQQYKIEILPFYICYDSIIQIVRNDLIANAYYSKVDKIFFVDSDMGWNAEDFISIVLRDEDVVGGIVPSRWYDDENWNVHINREEDIIYSRDKELIKVEKIGTGFLSLTRKVIVDLWNNSPKYTKENSNNTVANIFEVKITDNKIISEDYILSTKLKKLGYSLWGAHKINPTHIGISINKRNFSEYLQQNNYKI